MVAQRDVFKPRLVASNLDIPRPGPGKAARVWINTLNGLSRGERAVALAWAWYADDHGYCWPARSSVAKRAAYTVRSVQSLTESLIARGVLIEAGSKVTRGKAGDVVKRTRLYRLALGPLVPVMPKAEARRLARELAGESDKIALSTGSDGALSRVKKLHSQTSGHERIESEKTALSRPVESAKIAHNPSSNLGTADAAREGAPLTPARAAPTAGASQVKPSPIAARDPWAELDATLARRREQLEPQWWEAQARTVTSAHERPNSSGRRKDWRRGTP